jgi:hypothetical protein
MKVRGPAVIAGVVIGAIFALRALAFSDPPDPSWIGGFWDDDDYDDVVTLITSTAGVVESSPSLSPGPIRIVVAFVTRSQESPDLEQTPKSHRPRDPPAA